jgi:ADP-ribose pyrophosphatase
MEVAMSDAPTVLATGKFLRLVKKNGWEYVERIVSPSPVGIIAVTNDQKLLLIEQFRAPLASVIIEIPAGLVGDVEGQQGESWQLAAQRELLEETGYESTAVEFLTVGPTSAGLTSETVRLVRATGLRKVHSGPLGDGHEQIKLIELPLNEARSWMTAQAAAGRLIDAKVFAALWFVCG